MAMLSSGLEEQRTKLASGGAPLCAGSRGAPMPLVLGGVVTAGIATDCNGADPLLRPICSRVAGVVVQPSSPLDGARQH